MLVVAGDAVVVVFVALVQLLPLAGTYRVHGDLLQALLVSGNEQPVVHRRRRRSVQRVQTSVVVVGAGGDVRVVR